VLPIALFALAPAGASAHKPTGKFFCWANGTYYGHLKLRANGTYAYNDSYTGTWTYKRRQRRVKFTSGYFHPEFYGVHRHDADDNNAVVYLRARGTTAGYRCG
jgi:hypothetical protein